MIYLLVCISLVDGHKIEFRANTLDEVLRTLKTLNNVSKCDLQGIKQ